MTILHPHPRPRRLLACAAALVACAVGVTAQAAGNYGFLEDSAVSGFKESDVKLLTTAAKEVLASRDKGTTRSWKNDATGNSGKITLLASFTSTSNRDCRQLQLDNVAKGVNGTSRQVVCRATDGRWLFDPEARPRKD